VSATGVSLDVARELRAICGDTHVLECDTGELDVRPSSAEEVSAILRMANERGLRVIAVGGGTEFPTVWGIADIILDTARLTEIEHYDHADLTVGVGAGMTVAQLNALVGADRLMFASDPPMPERCTVGGLLATAGHGPLRHGYGAVRDYCIGVRFVTGDGRRAKGGGRVVKNVAGYDLMKLLIGSYGTLAVITSASFKLFPAPRQTLTFLAEFATATQALEFRDRVMCSSLSPMCLELVSPGARKLMRPEMTADAWVTCVRAAGSDAVLARYRKELGSAITRELEDEDERKMWRAIENFPNASEPGSASEQRVPFSSQVHISVPPSDVMRVIEILENAKFREFIRIAFVGRIGLGHLLAAEWPINLEDPWFLWGTADELKASMGSGVNMKLGHGAVRQWPVTPSHIASMRAVKLALDPNFVLRGRSLV
jgi:glycolate oxidase FAD binding subunit